MDYSVFRCTRSMGTWRPMPCDLQRVTVPEYCHGQNCPYFKEVCRHAGDELQDGGRIPRGFGEGA